MINPYSSYSRSAAADPYRSRQSGSLRSDGQVRQYGSIGVDVTGSMSRMVETQSLRPGNGVKTHTAAPAANAMAASTMNALLQIQAEAMNNGQDVARVRSADSSAYIASIAETAEMHITPIGGEAQSVEGLGYLPGDVFNNQKKKVEYVKGQIAQAEERARIEDQLRSEYGQDVKLAYDPLAGEHIMLRPGQPGYERVRSANEVFTQALKDLSKMGDYAAYADVRARYGLR